MSEALNTYLSCQINHVPLFYASKGVTADDINCPLCSARRQVHELTSSLQQEAAVAVNRQLLIDEQRKQIDAMDDKESKAYTESSRLQEAKAKRIADLEAMNQRQADSIRELNNQLTAVREWNKLSSAQAFRIYELQALHKDALDKIADLQTAKAQPSEIIDSYLKQIAELEATIRGLKAELEAKPSDLPGQPAGTIEWVNELIRKLDTRMSNKEGSDDIIARRNEHDHEAFDRRISALEEAKGQEPFCDYGIWLKGLEKRIEALESMHSIGAPHTTQKTNPHNDTP